MAGAAKVQEAVRGSSSATEAVESSARSGAATSTAFWSTAAGGASGAWITHPQPGAVTDAPAGAGWAAESFSPGWQQHGAFCSDMEQCCDWLSVTGAGCMAHAMACAGLTTPATTRASTAIQRGQNRLCRSEIIVSIFGTHTTRRSVWTR